ncbi:MAG: glycosyltransferase family 2 protein [Bacillota bacterium]
MSFDCEQSDARVSVGILTRNGGAVFHRVLQSLCRQQVPWPFEIVVLDSASTDGTDRLAESFGARVIPYRPARFRFGPARDYLFEHCRGEVVVTISQDVVPAGSRWLVDLVAPILADVADATVGEQVPPPGGYAFYWDYHGSWLRSVAIRFDQAHGCIAISCSNLAIRRSVWDVLRFGDCETIEDRVLQVKLHRAGYRMMQVKQALSYHGHDYSWEELNNRIAGFAMGWARLGWPYTLGRLLRDLIQPSRYLIIADAFLHRRLRNWKELIYPLAMCFMQYQGSRKAGADQ